MSRAASDRYERLREVLDAVSERAPEERAGALDELCKGDDGLRAEAVSLLRALDASGHLLEPAPVAPVSLSGMTLGSYAVGERIGAGGMGVVYRAKDTRLGRTVAVKALPDSVARDADRRLRLEREARVLAALSHPNIAAIHGVEDSPAGPVLVLQYVEGETLARRMERGAIPTDEVRAISEQVLRALEAAHSAGVVHRDIKPANVMVTPEGVVKVLDFGVARHNPRAGEPLQTPEAIRGGATRTGSFVGTAAYMSPEQARAKPADQRSDVWAFGCVLFEMLAGRSAFGGETVSDTIAAVLRAEPEWSRLGTRAPAGVVRVLRRCLEKDPERRSRNAGDVRLDLQDAWEARDAGPAPVRWRIIVMVGAVCLLLGGLLVSVWSGVLSASTRPAPIRLSIDIPPDKPLRMGPFGDHAAVSPDGTTIAYAAGARTDPGPMLYLRRTDSFTPTLLPGTSGAMAPFFAPDGRSIGYWRVQRNTASLMRTNLEGGPPQLIAEVGARICGACWTPGGEIIFASGPPWGLRRVGVGGGPISELTKLDENTESTHGAPEIMPDGVTVLFTHAAIVNGAVRTRIDSVRLDSGARTTVLDNAASPRYLPGKSGQGLLVFSRGNAVLGVSMDLRTLGVVGEPRVVGGGRATDSPAPLRCAVSAGSGGVLAYARMPDGTAGGDLAWFHPDGTVRTVYHGDDPIVTLRLSPDGNSVAFSTVGPNPGVWVLDLRRGAAVRITDVPGSAFPVWTPDGRRIAFASGTAEAGRRVMWAPADASSAPELLYGPGPAGELFPTDFSPDGRWLAVCYGSAPAPSTDTDVMLLDTRNAMARRYLFDAAADRVGLRFSRDGTLVAYCSAESGTLEVYVQPFPSMDRKLRVSPNGGARVVWSPEGTRLTYQCDTCLYAAEITLSPTLSASTPLCVIQNIPSSRHDAAPGQERFLMARPRGEWAPPTRIDVEIGALRDLGLK